MLDGLRVGDNGGVENGFVVDLAGRVRFFDNAINRRTLRARGLLTQLLKGFFKPINPFVVSPRWAFSHAIGSRLVAFSIIFGSD